MTGATRSSLDRLARPLAAANRAAWAALALGSALLLLGAMAWIARLGLMNAPYWVLVAWALVAISVTLVGWSALRGASAYSTDGLASWLEERSTWRTGALTSLLQAAAPGTSGPLLAAADVHSAADLDARGRDALEPVRRPLGARVRAGVLALVLGLGALGSAGPVSGPAAALWHPARAWEMTTSPVRITASASEIARGDSVTLELEAIGRRQAVLWTRAPGESWQAAAVVLDSSGRATRVIGPLRSDLHARLTSGGRSSDTLLVQVRLPVFLGSLTVTARYPRYLGMEDEPVPTSGDTIILPAGTRLETRGSATAALRSAIWEGAGRVQELQVAGSDFSGTLVPSVSTEYRLLLVTAAGAAIGGDTARLPVRVVADAAPQVDVPVPGADTVAPLSMKLPLVIDVRDDHGLTGVALELRRGRRGGGRDSLRPQPIALPAGRPDRAILAAELDLALLSVEPGDTLWYRARAVDNAPAARVGRSREFLVRVPTTAELRAAQREATAGIGSRLDSLADRSRQLARETQDVARTEQRGQENSPASGDDALSFEQAKKAEAVAKAQEQLINDAEAVRDALDALEKSAESSGLDDPEFRQRLEELQQQLDRALTPEMREKLAELQRALQELSAERTQDALKDLAKAQEALREALERSRELFKRAALEGDLANLAEESRDLAKEQQKWNEEVARADSNRAAAAERELADRADSLASAMRQTAEQMETETQQQKMEQAAENASEAANEMREAQQMAKAGNRQGARQKGQQASQKLEPLGEQMKQQKDAMQDEWRAEVTEALDRALAETSRLTERELSVQERFRSGTPSAEARAEQAAVEDGVDRLAAQLQRAAGKNALVSQQIAASLALAKEHMSKAREAVSTGAPNPRAAAERAGAAVDALNTAAYQLVRSRGDVAGAASGSGMAEAMEQMAQLAGQQGQIGQQGASLLPMAGRGDIRAQLQRLGAQQRALAEQLERMRAQGSTPGAAELAEEAKDLARRLEAGRIDRQTVERQERLFRRMLDAGRTLQGQERDEKKERESTAGSDDDARLPPALRARLLGEGAAPRLPSWEELQRLSPEDRRLVVDYFRRLSEASE